MSSKPVSQMVTVFRSRLRADAGADYARTAEEMERLARAIPGFVDFKQFVADDGERVSVITFASQAAHDAWRDDPRHRVAQQRGRDHWYAEYRIQVCELVAERTFVAHADD
ncbi:MAG: antibiotic biosynthesis monooxygenase [Acidimicrobiia bacterium]